LFKPKQEVPAEDSVRENGGFPAQEQEDGRMGESTDSMDVPPDGEGAFVDAIGGSSQGIRGDVHWHVPAAILALDSGRLEPDAIHIPGYRVQLFMGRLENARSLKRSLELDGVDQPVHVTPYPPLFGVTVGNFTSSLAAHRVREAWRQRFPDALVVHLDLPLEVVFPEGEIPDHGP